MAKKKKVDESLNDTITQGEISGSAVSDVEKISRNKKHNAKSVEQTDKVESEQPYVIERQKSKSKAPKSNVEEQKITTEEPKVKAKTQKCKSQAQKDKTTINITNAQTEQDVDMSEINVQENLKNLTKSKKVKSVLGKIWDIILWIITIVLVGLALVCVILLIIGYRPAVVLTPSMSPAIKPGDLVIYKAVDAETINVGDVITFWPSSSDDTSELSVTHRVIEIIADGDGTLTFITHGDANSENSTEHVAQEQIIGKVTCVVPWVGQVFLFIKNNLIVFIFGVISFVILCYLLSYLYKAIKEDKAKKSANADDKVNMDSKNTNAPVDDQNKIVEIKSNNKTDMSKSQKDMSNEEHCNIKAQTDTTTKQTNKRTTKK